MDNYFIYTLFIGIFITYIVLPPPKIIYKSNNTCYKITNQEVACKK